MADQDKVTEQVNGIATNLLDLINKGNLARAWGALIGQGKGVGAGIAERESAYVGAGATFDGIVGFVDSATNFFRSIMQAFTIYKTQGWDAALDHMKQNLTDQTNRLKARGGQDGTAEADVNETALEKELRIQRERAARRAGDPTRAFRTEATPDRSEVTPPRRDVTNAETADPVDTGVGVTTEVKPRSVFGDGVTVDSGKVLVDPDASPAFGAVGTRTLAEPVVQ